MCLSIYYNGVGIFKFGSLFELGWKHWYKRLSIYCDGAEDFQGIKRLDNEQQTI